MNHVFADAHFFFAILNPHDTAHAKAIDFGSITAALTGDHHFEQAGFTALLNAR